MFYPNPFFEVTQGALGLSWYFKNPLSALATLILKFVSAFDFDYILPYIYNLKPWYRWVSGFFSLSIFYFGLWGVISYTFSKTKETFFFGPRLFPLVCLASWASVALLSMYELRFGLPMLVLFFLFSAERILHMQEMNRATLYRSLVVYICVISLFLFLAEYAATQNILLNEALHTAFMK